MLGFTSMAKKMQARKDITDFSQQDGESFSQAWGRFSKILKFIPNHGFYNNVIYHSFYYGLNSEYRQKLDRSVQGVFMNLTVEEGKSLIEAITLNEEQYYNEPPKVKERGIHPLSPEDMNDARNALITHGKSIDEIKRTSINLAEQYEEEDRIRLALQHFKFQQ